MLFDSQICLETSDHLVTFFVVKVTFQDSLEFGHLKGRFWFGAWVNSLSLIL